MIIYKVANQDHMGYEVKTTYWFNQENAEKEFKNRIRQIKKTLHVAKRDDLDDKKPIELSEGDNFNKDIIKKASIAYWEKVNYEYDEWDLYHYEIRIEKITVSDHPHLLEGEQTK